MALLEAIPQQVWTARPNGELDFVNDRVLDYFAATSEEILGSGWQSVIAPQDLSHALERWRHALGTGDTYEVEFRLRRADGIYRWHLTRALPLRNRQGVIIKWFGTNTDIDETKKARDDLQRRSQYEQQLIGIVSHDLRNPLNAIAMAASLLLRRGSLDDQQGKVVAHIVSSTERAVRLIRDFMDFAHTRAAGSIPVVRGVANLRQIVQQIIDELSLAYPDRTIDIRAVGDVTGPWDPDRIAQVIGNLVGNAFQHGGPGSTVRIELSDGKNQVQCSVQNQGTPIPPDDKARLFEPFQRGDAARSSGQPSAERGIGLGLYISREIVVAHGGTISVESHQATGTVFTFTLPRPAALPTS